MDNRIAFIDYGPELSSYFRDLNLAWLRKYFSVEEMDEKVLGDPDEYIIKGGGAIYFATLDGTIAGTFALWKVEKGIYELAKMAVDDVFQGRKIGNAILDHSIRKAREFNASRLILYSNTILAPAIHLYRKYGFREVPLGEALYNRANIKMELELQVANS